MAKYIAIYYLFGCFVIYYHSSILFIIWTARIINEKVLRRLNKDRELLRNVKHKKMFYVGQAKRGNRYRILKLTMSGKNVGREVVERKQNSWLKNIRDYT